MQIGSVKEKKQTKEIKRKNLHLARLALHRVSCLEQKREKASTKKQPMNKLTAERDEKRNLGIYG
jgi:hypothetical protein